MNVWMTELFTEAEYEIEIFDNKLSVKAWCEKHLKSMSAETRGDGQWRESDDMAMFQLARRQTIGYWLHEVKS